MVNGHVIWPGLTKGSRVRVTCAYMPWPRRNGHYNVTDPCDDVTSARPWHHSPFAPRFIILHLERVPGQQARWRSDKNHRFSLRNCVLWNRQFWPLNGVVESNRSYVGMHSPSPLRELAVGHSIEGSIMFGLIEFFLSVQCISVFLYKKVPFWFLNPIRYLR